VGRWAFENLKTHGIEGDAVATRSIDRVLLPSDQRERIRKENPQT